MATTNESKLEQQVESLTNRVSTLVNNNARLLDDFAALKNNHSQLVQDIEARFEAIHEKIFR